MAIAVAMNRACGDRPISPRVVRRPTWILGVTSCAMVTGCATALQGGSGVMARSAAAADQPAIVQGTVPFAILLVIGLLISRNFKSD